MNDAYFSPCQKYRYMLRRQWAMDAKRYCLFVMLNPSTADAIEDDPTIRRCIGYAKSWGYDVLLVGNAYAYRSTDPSQLWTVDDPVGPENDERLAQMSALAGLVVAAWGSNVQPGRAVEVIDTLRKFNDVHFLSLTRDGQPKHPLYLRKDLQPQVLCTAPTESGSRTDPGMRRV